jgi:uncharacterized protein YlaI
VALCSLCWTPNGFLSRFLSSNRSANRKVRCALCPEALAQSRYAHGIPAATAGRFDFAPIKLRRDAGMGHRSRGDHIGVITGRAWR